MTDPNLPPNDESRYAPPDDDAPAADESPDVLDEPVDDVLPPLNLDVDSALAAVYGLDDMLAEQEAEESAREAARAAYEQRLRDDADRLEDIRANPMPLPVPLQLNRGSVAALLPGLALVGTGVWLTVAYTTNNPPAPGVLPLMVIANAAIIFLAAWWGSARWNRGTLFFALTIGLTGAAAAFGGAYRWPLVFGALGAGLILSGLMARPMNTRLVFPGVMLLVVGGIIFAQLTNAIPKGVYATVEPLRYFIVIFAGLLLVIGWVSRLGGR